jgi:hypothetical protein
VGLCFFIIYLYIYIYIYIFYRVSPAARWYMLQLFRAGISLAIQEWGIPLVGQG